MKAQTKRNETKTGKTGKTATPSTSAQVHLWSGLLGLLLYALVCPMNAAFAAPSPEGYWKMIDDKTNKPSSIVKVFEKDKVMYAKVIQLLNLKPGERPDPVCSNCKGWRKNKPVLGMLFMWGMKKASGETWSGGKILDPDEGKTYRCKIWVEKSGRELKVRGYVLVFYRTQTWHRVTAKKSIDEALASYARYTQKPKSSSPPSRR